MYYLVHNVLIFSYPTLFSFFSGGHYNLDFRLNYVDTNYMITIYPPHNQPSHNHPPYNHPIRCFKK